MKFYVAEIVATGIAFLCALTNHAGACWVWRKLMPLDQWASNVMDRRGVNQLHRFAPPPGINVPTSPYASSWTVCSCSAPRPATVHLNGAAMSYHYCPAHGVVKPS